MYSICCLSVQSFLVPFPDAMQSRRPGEMVFPLPLIGFVYQQTYVGADKFFLACHLFSESEYFWLRQNLSRVQSAVLAVVRNCSCQRSDPLCCQLHPEFQDQGDIVSLFAPFFECCNRLGSGAKFFLCHHATVVTLKCSSLRESFSLSLANVSWHNLVVSFVNSLSALQVLCMFHRPSQQRCC